MKGSWIEFTCLCGHAHEIVQLSSELPVKTVVCHCDSCRHNKGALHYTALPLQTAPDCISTLRKYLFSAKIERYFCPNCGSHVCYYLPTEDVWHIATGAVDRLINEDEQVFGGLEQIVEHQFVGDTRDGGLAIFLTGSVQDSAQVFLQAPHATPPEQNMPTNVGKSSTLPAACHCGAVSFFITRPDEGSAAFSAPWPDLLRPYHLHDSAASANQTWWIVGNKFLAGTCACRSCRLANATPITCWAFVPKANIFHPDGLPWQNDAADLCTFNSSGDNYRDFCGNCGASIFWRSKTRPELFDISVGILRAAEGSRAHSWLQWCTERVSFIEEAFDEPLIASFAEQLKLMKQ